MARIVCFGDSLTTCGGENGRYSDILQDRFPEHTFVNKGAGGETFVDGRERLQEDVRHLDPDIVLLEFGANDWWQDERSCRAWARDLEDFVGQIKQTGAEIVVLGVFGDSLAADGSRRPKQYGTDERAIAYRDLEAAVAAKYGCRYVANIQESIIEDRCCWRDRNHPNELGNRRVADTIQPHLEALLGQKPLPVRSDPLLTTRDAWREAAALAGNRLAVVDGDRRLTFAEAADQVEALAGNLWQTAGETRPTVAVSLPNCLEYFLVYWAIARLGGVVVPLNTWLRTDNLKAILRNVQPDLLIVRNRSDRDVLAAAETVPGLRVFALDPAGTDLDGLAQLLGPAPFAPDVEIGPDELSIIMHTSGTTGVPKGAMMRHSDLRFNVAAAVNAHQFCTSDVHLLVNPMFHCTALYSSLPTAAYQKCPVVITANTTPDGLMQLVERERITTFLSIPTIFQRLVALPDLPSYDASSLRVIAYAGSMMPISTIRALQKHFPDAELHNFFGLTETISMTHVLSGEDAFERPDSIGRLLPFVEARVVGEAMTEVPAGEVGELLFARQNVIPGYFGQPGKLEESVVRLHDGEWFRTGDLAAVDEDGYFFVRGRTKDMIIVAGENVYASEVEAVIMEMDAVAEAAVRGIPATGVRASLGELIKAYVARRDPSLTERDVRAHCHERMPAYKVPHVVEFLEQLPRNPSGKVVKTKLR